MEIKISPGIYKGMIHVPPSKSDAQRAYLAAALSKGNSRLFNCGSSADEQHMLEAIQILGAKIERLEKGEILIRGMENFPKNVHLNCGESGLGVRLLTAVCASQAGKTTIDGKGSLLARPMAFFEQVLPRFHAKITTKNGFLPVKLEGPMLGSKVEVDGSLSSQFISGLLMALPLVEGNSTLYVSQLNSLQYVKMTVATLSRFGIQIEVNENFSEFIIKGNQQYQPCSYQIEGDWSAASYGLVASALGMDIGIQGLSMDSLQADKAILQAFESANCSVTQQNECIRINGSQRKAFAFDATQCPDLFPALATFAALCPGISKIKGIHRLIHKESNRAVALQTEFSKLGIEVELSEDVMFITGKDKISGGTVFSHNDHRIAMCLGILGIFATNELSIDAAESVSKSYPDFWKDLSKLKTPTV